MALGGNLVLMETVTDLRMTSDEAPEPALNSFQGGGGKRYAPLALLQMPALNLFQGRLLWPVLVLGGVLLLAGLLFRRKPVLSLRRIHLSLR